MNNTKKILESGLIFKIPEDKRFTYIRSMQRLSQLDSELRDFDKLPENILKMKLKQYHCFFVVVEELNKFLK